MFDVTKYLEALDVVSKFASMDVSNFSTADGLLALMALDPFYIQAIETAEMLKPLVVKYSLAEYLNSEKED